MPVSQIPDLPSNSRYPKEEVSSERPNTQRIPISRVTTGKVRQKKKSFIDSFAASFFGDTGRSIGEYIMYDVLIPAAKETISDMVKGALNMLFYGERTDSNVRRDKGRSYVAYESMSRYDNRRPEIRERRDPRLRASLRFDDVILTYRQDAENVLSNMVDLLERYDQVTIDDFNQLIGIESDVADRKYGWDNLSRATVQRVPDGWIVDLPRPIPLD